jgi:flavorubredoxin
VLYEQTTGTLFCGDLFTHLGNGPPLVKSDIVGPAMVAEKTFHATSIGPATGLTIRRLGQLHPRVLALMHGSSFEGDGTEQLEDLADAYDRLLEGTAKPH